MGGLAIGLRVGALGGAGCRRTAHFPTRQCKAFLGQPFPLCQECDSEYERDGGPEPGWGTDSGRRHRCKRRRSAGYGLGGRSSKRSKGQEPVVGE